MNLYIYLDQPLEELQSLELLGLMISFNFFWADNISKLAAESATDEVFSMVQIHSLLNMDWMHGISFLDF